MRVPAIIITDARPSIRVSPGHGGWVAVLHIGGLDRNHGRAAAFLVAAVTELRRGVEPCPDFTVHVPNGSDAVVCVAGTEPDAMVAALDLQGAARAALLKAATITRSGARRGRRAPTSLKAR